MTKKKRKKIFLITSLLSLSGLILSIIFLPPAFTFSISFIKVSAIGIAFILIFIFLYSLIAYIFRSFIHGILVGLFPVVYLSMRLHELTSPLFFVLLAGVFVALEILLIQIVRKPTR